MVIKIMMVTMMKIKKTVWVKQIMWRKIWRRLQTKGTKKVTNKNQNEKTKKQKIKTQYFREKKKEGKFKCFVFV